MVSQSLVDRATLDELEGVIGTDKLTRLVDRFTASLATAFDGADRAEADYAREAHTLVSMSGMLGCADLSQACRDFEQAVKGGGTDLAARLAALRSLRDATVAALRDLREDTPAVR
ncbi:Hpt domain-containing protein [Methylobacterium sp. J-001]|jgi:HPt (histidine-containing phosphotransfer) domain-containing protein|uniref:Hpt domain-containing protein n=1 Tax=unclassified Methylobacterium TaxID=2615210 RepID=UPI000AA511DE|nr:MULTISPECIES: Hpt domain-containing protein [unclassified Methylobacterium]MCJ2120743.1 Hpt domain-containing protein [Methylobacterium sp. J-001]